MFCGRIDRTPVPRAHLFLFHKTQDAAPAANQRIQAVDGEAS